MQPLRLLSRVMKSPSLGVRSFRNTFRGVKSLVIAEHANGALLPGRSINRELKSDKWLILIMLMIFLSARFAFTSLFYLLRFKTILGTSHFNAGIWFHVSSPSIQLAILTLSLSLCSSICLSPYVLICVCFSVSCLFSSLIWRHSCHSHSSSKNRRRSWYFSSWI